MSQSVLKFCKCGSLFDYKLMATEYDDVQQLYLKCSRCGFLDKVKSKSIKLRVSNQEHIEKFHGDHMKYDKTILQSSSLLCPTTECKGNLFPHMLLFTHLEKNKQMYALCSHCDMKFKVTSSHFK